MHCLAVVHPAVQGRWGWGGIGGEQAVGLGQWVVP